MKRSRKRTSRKGVEPPSQQQQKLSKVIGYISWALTLSPLVPIGYLILHVGEITEVARNLIALCFGLYGVITAIKPQVNEKLKDLQPKEDTDVMAHLKARRYRVGLLGMSFFANVSMLIPVFYLRGYIAMVAAWLPGKEQIGDKIPLLVSFLLSAVISGVLGNLAYDFLKYLVRRIEKKRKVSNFYVLVQFEGGKPESLEAGEFTSISRELDKVRATLLDGRSGMIGRTTAYQLSQLRPELLKKGDRFVVRWLRESLVAKNDSVITELAD